MKRDNPIANRIAPSANVSERFLIPSTSRRRTETVPWRLQSELRYGEEIQTIVVPLDGSPYAEQALPHALAIARGTGASLRIVHAYFEPFALEPWQDSAVLVECQFERRNYLNRIVEQIARVDDVPVEIVMIDSPDTIDALMKGVAGSDLVIMASRRRRVVSRLWWQSRVDQLRRRLSVPLLVTKGNSAAVDLTVTPRLKQILLPLDGAAPDQTVLDCATFAARMQGGTVTLLNVQNEEWTAGLFPHSGPREYLSWTIDRLKQEGIDAAAYVLTTSQDFRRAIQSYAESHDVDLIAIPTNGDGGMTRLMRSSVADYLLRNSKLPILLQSIPGPAKRPELTKVT